MSRWLALSIVCSLAYYVSLFREKKKYFHLTRLTFPQLTAVISSGSLNRKGKLYTGLTWPGTLQLNMLDQYTQANSLVVSDDYHY